MSGRSLMMTPPSLSLFLPPPVLMLLVDDVVGIGEFDVNDAEFNCPPPLTLLSFAPMSPWPVVYP